MNPLLQLQDFGQSVWLDFITRRFIAQGKLKKLIDDDGLRGVTSNPTIFQKAVSGGTEYDADIRRGIEAGKKTGDIFEALAVSDIQQACDTLRGVYNQSNGADGFVSIEVQPHLARDTGGTLEEVRRLWQEVGRPNVMVKIPGTKEGLPAIEQALSEGVNINITLIFALKRYEEVIDAWLAGLERAAKSGKQLAPIASVASFFVSRVDTLVDRLLEEKIAKASAEKKDLESLFGKAAIANAEEAYRIFQKMVAGPRFKALEAKSARAQRPLWASTSTKNPKYRDVLYVEELIGKHTVNTMPLATIDAFRDHGKVREALPVVSAATQQTLKRLSKAGIDMDQVTRQLEDEGIDLFAKSYDELLQSIDQKREALKVTAR